MWGPGLHRRQNLFFIEQPAAGNLTNLKQNYSEYLEKIFKKLSSAATKEIF